MNFVFFSLLWVLKKAILCTKAIHHKRYWNAQKFLLEKKKSWPLSKFFFRSRHVSCNISNFIHSFISESQRKKQQKWLTIILSHFALLSLKCTCFWNVVVSSISKNKIDEDDRWMCDREEKETITKTKSLLEKKNTK